VASRRWNDLFFRNASLGAGWELLMLDGNLEPLGLGKVRGSYGEVDRNAWAQRDTGGAVVNPYDVVRAIREVDFPAAKGRLLQAAQHGGAPGAVLDTLRALSSEEYVKEAEVARSVSVDPAPGRSAGQRAAQARQRRQHPGRVSQHLRDVPSPPFGQERER
jgi:hypothetical protein